MCYYSCPRIGLPIDSIEKRIFGRERSPNEVDTGTIRASYIARSKDPAILKSAQDGGVATSLLTYAIESGIVNYAIGTTRSSENPWKPKPAILKARQELLSSSGTKVTASASLTAVAEAWAGYPDSRFAFVGLPCQIQGLRKILVSDHGPRKYGESVELAIGLFCNNSYQYNKLILDYLKTQKNCDLQTVTKMRLDAKDDCYRVYKGDDKILDVPSKEIESHVLAGCSKCNDFSSELADLSIGANGAPDGWCTLLVRSEKGEKIVAGAIEKNLIEVKPLGGGLAVVTEICRSKKKRDASYISHST
jgi:coenzyme F420 hydrogenase subunit beta